MAHGNAITTQNGLKVPTRQGAADQDLVGFHPTVAAVWAAMRQAAYRCRSWAPYRQTLRRLPKALSCGPGGDGWMSTFDA